MDIRTLEHARILWDYHCLDLGVAPADFVLALGSHDEGVAVRAAELVLQGLAPLLVTSGGLGRVTRDLWSPGASEGERFAGVARKCGVAPEQILVEDKATNTGENITLTRQLLAEVEKEVRSGIVVTKPYMRRRAYATAAKQWPEVYWLVTSENLSFDEYIVAQDSPQHTIELVVGDFQRIPLYAEKGFQIPQPVPAEVWHSYHELVKLGFDKYVLNA